MVYLITSEILEVIPIISIKIIQRYRNLHLYSQNINYTFTFRHWNTWVYGVDKRRRRSANSWLICGQLKRNDWMYNGMNRALLQVCDITSFVILIQNLIHDIFHCNGFNILFHFWHSNMLFPIKFKCT